jgi:hypothetical protein
VPHPPKETLKQGYGDCKDKAVLLLALLRAAEIPANVALLNAENREDVPADLPGIGMFDHAIVYVPGSPALWIDATDDYARAGQLPSADQGRIALVAAAGTTSLVTTTISSPQENLLVEEREFFLAGYGPAKVIEKTQAHGTFESQYRRSYANPQDKKVRDDLDSYFKAHYLGGNWIVWIAPIPKISLRRLNSRWKATWPSAVKQISRRRWPPFAWKGSSRCFPTNCRTGSLRRTRARTMRTLRPEKKGRPAIN